MQQKLNNFFEDLKSEISINASTGIYQIEAFMAKYLSQLIDSGEIFDCEPCENPKLNGAHIHGFYTDENDEDSQSRIRVDLFITDYDQRQELENLTKTEIETWFKRLFKFFSESLNKEFYKKLDISSSAYPISEYIWLNRNNIEQLNLYFLSERALSERVSDYSKETLENINIRYNLYDINKLYNLETSTNQRESIEINFLEDYGKSIDCLVAHLGKDSLESYLAVVPGDILADIYNDHGERLLEQNVRSFLQARGKVNRGIRDTIIKEPSHFFSFNNGITATARKIITNNEDGFSRIESLTDLQIVNGGQTTASLARAKARDNADLSQVFVQMKLSIVEEDEEEKLVPKISQYANTQNTVNIADLSANHPFHIKIEEFSRKIWAPAKEGEIRETSWFYERSRGQYNVLLSRQNAKADKAKYPKNQMFSKTDLAKYMMVWETSEPKWINMGAQKNFIKFSELIAKHWETKGFSDTVNEFYFKKLICRAIIFKDTEKMVLSQPWYTNGYRANIVIYTLAYLARFLKNNKKDLDYISIWSRQEPTLALKEVIKSLAKKMNSILTEENPNRTTSNISEWAKKDACWTDIIQNHTTELDSSFTPAFVKELVSSDEIKAIEKEAEKDERFDNDLNVEIRINNKGIEYWKAFLKYLETNINLTYAQRGILFVAQRPNQMLSLKQCKVLDKLLQKHGENFEDTLKNQALFE